MLRKGLRKVLMVRDFSLGLSFSGELNSSPTGHVGRPLNFQVVLLFYCCDIYHWVTELKVGYICSDLQKQAEHMEGVYRYSSSPMRSSMQKILYRSKFLSEVIGNDLESCVVSFVQKRYASSCCLCCSKGM